MWAIDVTADGAPGTPRALHAFGDGDAFARCSLFVTSLYGDTVWQFAVGRAGLALVDGPSP